MWKIVLTVEGMMCGMCESHINDAVRAAFPVKKVTSSHTKGQTVILTEQDIDEKTLFAVIEKTGYTAISVTKEPYVKKRLFSFAKFSK
jgi:copper chaperone CopZ